MWKEGMVMLGLLICGIVGIVVSRRRWGRRPVNENFPPGPFAWPVIGHLQVFSHLPHQALAGLSKKYGDVIGLRLGQQLAVVLSSPQLAKEVLLTHDKLFAHRPPFQFNSILLFGTANGIFSNPYGPAWRKHRKICMLQLFTAKRLHELQYVQQEEVRALLLSILHQSSGGTTAINLGRCVRNMSTRLIMRLLHSRATTQVRDENVEQLLEDLEQAMVPTMGDFIPSLSFLDIFKKQRMRRVHARLDKFFTEMLMERKESTFQRHEDLLHALLSEEESLTVVDIKSILMEMLGAGINTTALAIEWAMAELLRKPDCLRQLQREIDTQLAGKKKQITEADLPKLSYLKCVIKEASRLHPVLPLLPRMPIEECKVQGYTIPAKTLVYVNAWAIGRDERVWPNANEFIPHRFEGKDIDLKGQHFELLPFGSGRRACLGISLAVPLIDQILANLVSCFDWELPYGETHRSVNMDERRGFVSNRATPIIAIPKPRVSLSNLPYI